MAFLIAFGDEEPWAIIQTPFTPKRGAPPVSEWSTFFLKLIKLVIKYKSQNKKTR